MPENQPQQLSEVIFAWRHQEYEKHRKSVWWYMVSLAVLLLLIWWSVIQNDYMFAVFLVLFYLVILMYEYRHAEIIDFAITPDGVKSGVNFWSYKGISKFFIVYHDHGVKNIYFEFKNPLRGRLIVPLDGQDAVAIREFLLGYLTEDLEQEAEPLSEQIRRWLKL